MFVVTKKCETFVTDVMFLIKATENFNKDDTYWINFLKITKVFML